MYSARKLTDEQRSAVANYFAVYKGHEADKIKIALGANSQVLHPAVQNALTMLKRAWPVRGTTAHTQREMLPWLGN